MIARQEALVLIVHVMRQFCMWIGCQILRNIGDASPFLFPMELFGEATQEAGRASAETSMQVLLYLAPRVRIFLERHIAEKETTVSNGGGGVGEGAILLS